MNGATFTGTRQPNKENNNAYSLHQIAADPDPRQHASASPPAKTRMAPAAGAPSRRSAPASAPLAAACWATSSARAVAASPQRPLVPCWAVCWVTKSAPASTALTVPKWLVPAPPPIQPPIGQGISWNNPQSGHSGVIVPVRDGYDNTSGAYCREFDQKVTIGGQTQSAYGTACQQPDGSWKIVQQ